MAVVVGADASGLNHLIVDRTDKQCFELIDERRFCAVGSIFRQDETTLGFYNREQAARQAFELLQLYNEFGGTTYPAGFRVELPRHRDYGSERIVDFSRGMLEAAGRFSSLTTFFAASEATDVGSVVISEDSPAPVGQVGGWWNNALLRLSGRLPFGRSTDDAATSGASDLAVE